MPAKKLSVEEHWESFVRRFWNKVKKGNDDECWEWQASSIAGGYGVLFTVRYEAYVGIPSNRCSWEINIGPIPEGMHVLHSCDNRLCCNPKHLFLGTNLDNIKDRMHKNRSRKSKLTEEEIAYVRVERKNSTPRSVLAKKFGVSGPLISLISSEKVGGKTPC